MIELAVKNILSKKIRSILTILGIVVALQLYIVLSGIMNSYDRDIQKQISAMAGKVFVQSKSESGASMLPLQNIISESDADYIINKYDNIDKDASTKIIFNEIVPSSAPNMPPSVLAVGLEPNKEHVFIGDTDVNGKSKLSTSKEIILGASAAAWAKKEHNAGLNDNITIKGTTFKIVGILPNITTVIDSSVIMDLKVAQDLYAKNNVVNTVIITSKHADKVDNLAEKINNDYPKLSASTSKEMKQSAEKMLSGQRTFFAMINNTIIIVAAFMIMITMIMSVHERKKEIGTLKAIGSSRTNIIKLIMSETCILSIIGGIVALPISYVFIWCILGFQTENIAFYNNPSQWPFIVLVAVIIGVISGLWPALSAQKVSPLESIRYE